jgi:predicted P-loop ATPase
MTEGLPNAAPLHDAKALLEWLHAHNFQLVYWSREGDNKGPRQHDWQHKTYTIKDWLGPDKTRVGLKLGVPIADGQYPCDVDIDWAEGARLALAFLPGTNHVYGRKGKKISHCVYLTNSAVTTFRFEDPVDKTCLIEMRGAKADGTIGFQSMIPPSVWSNNGRQEPLEYIKFGMPTLYETAIISRAVTLAAITMLLGRQLGKNGFGHEMRLAWAGLLVRAGLTDKELETMGRELSHHCNNLQVADVVTTITTTRKNLQDPEKKKKVRGKPALTKMLGPNGRLIVQCICKWLNYEQDFIRDRKGNIIDKNHFNVMRAIEQLGHTLSYDEFAEQLLIDGEPLSDAHWHRLQVDIEVDYHFQPPSEYLKTVIPDACRRNRFHPVLDYLNALKWDGTPRIDEWLITCAGAEDTAYVRAVSAIMLIAAVRRVRVPGCKYDELMVWESRQGTNKSSAAAMLCPKPEWFSDDLRLNMQSKELIEATLGKWLIEASELSGKRKTEIEQLKAMLSRQVDGPARMAYAHFPVSRKRQFILIGSTNREAYLPDSTGNRRFWPVKVQQFNLRWIEQHRDQLWAEAVYRESQGESIRLPEKLWPAATEQQERRRESDSWEDVLCQALLEHKTEANGDVHIATCELYEALHIPIERQDRVSHVRLSEIMQRFGCEKKKVRVIIVNSKQAKSQSLQGYVCPKATREKLKRECEEEESKATELELRQEDGDIPF